MEQKIIIEALKTASVEQLLSELEQRKSNELEWVIECVFQSVEFAFLIKKDDFLGKGKKQINAEARGVAMYILRHETNLGFKEIGEICGGKDHATVMHWTNNKIPHSINFDKELYGRADWAHKCYRHLVKKT